MLKIFKRNQPQQNSPSVAEGFLTQAVHLKYNLYMLGQAVVFAAVLDKCKNYDEAVQVTAEIMLKLNAENQKNGRN